MPDGISHSRLLLLLGPPRSGSTILARCIAQHSNVDAILEPYQRRRAESYSETSRSRLCIDFGVDAANGRTLLVKETFTRRENVYHCLELARSSQAHGDRPVIVLLSRSPVEAFVSQIKAVKEKWKKKTALGFDESSAKVFFRTYLLNYRRVFDAELQCPRMVVFYDRFCDTPQGELERIMNAAGLTFEPAQLNLSTGSGSALEGGDPGAHASGGIAKKSSSDVVDLFRDRIGSARVGQKMLELHSTLIEIQEAPISAGTSIEERLRGEMAGLTKELFPFAVL